MLTPSLAKLETHWLRVQAATFFPTPPPAADPQPSLSGNGASDSGAPHLLVASFSGSFSPRDEAQRGPGGSCSSQGRPAISPSSFLSPEEGEGLVANRPGVWQPESAWVPGTGRRGIKESAEQFVISTLAAGGGSRNSCQGNPPPDQAAPAPLLS